ncbi:hypothetical protein K3888_09345 [Dietzia aurantiaca]|uniref:hypothetical protein n=1 Tax=Dietzia aurantiaca TaxID=983873 RepID=UPI001E3ECCCF|nr:hypothetical protein [Dietzia aurantiaca]MCD2262906.1 hypothetical protein [Dietzia aurantiaca]
MVYLAKEFSVKPLPRMLLLSPLVAGMALALSPAAAAQPVSGSVIEPVVVPRPFDIPIWQLPALPYPFEWQFHLPQMPPPPSYPAPALNPKPGDVCANSRIGELSPNKLRCTFMGTPNPARWVEVAPGALNPDGTLKPGAGG